MIHVVLFLAACSGLLVAIKCHAGRAGSSAFISAAAGGAALILGVVVDAEPFATIATAVANGGIWASVAMAMGWIGEGVAD